MRGKKIKQHDSTQTQKYFLLIHFFFQQQQQKQPTKINYLLYTSQQFQTKLHIYLHSRFE